MNKQECTKLVTSWLESSVIGLNLCPFARKPFIENRVRIVIDESEDYESFFVNLISELQTLSRLNPEELETTVLATLNLFADFEEYLGALSFANDLLESNNWEGEIQIASFHPGYEFEGEASAASNFTNRSPVPLFHLIRESSLSEMLAKYPDSDDIPKQNIELMESLSEEELRARFPWSFQEQDNNS